MATNQDDPRWRISPFGAQAGQPETFAPQVRFADCTLRDGEQMAGIVFTVADKLEIARRLDAAGIHEIEAGTPVVSAEDREALQAITGAGLKAKISALARARKDDIDLVADCGAWGVRISLPISQIQRGSKFALSDEQYLKLALQVTEHAKSRGLACIFSPYDTSRSDLPFLSRVIGELSKAGTVDRIRFVDTAGCATPEIVRFVIGRMREAGDIPVEVHCHDDFGLAVANTIAGAAAGAEYMSVTVNGIGERCGNAALEEVALALHVLYGVDTGLDLTHLVELSRLVEERSGIRLHEHKSVVGRGAFAHESGMVVAGVLKDPFTAETYAPELVGQQRRIVLGKKSGLESVRARLSALALEMSDAQARALLDWVKTEATRTKRPVSDDAFRAHAQSLAQASLSLPGGGAFQ